MIEGGGRASSPRELLRVAWRRGGSSGLGDAGELEAAEVSSDVILVVFVPAERDGDVALLLGFLLTVFGRVGPRTCGL